MDIHKSITLTHISNPEFLSLDIQNLIKKAKEATSNAYAPYSKFYVGASALLDSGEIYTGSNQENAAYPSGLCAERVLLNTIMHNHAGKKIIAMAITAVSQNYALPKVLTSCGGCLQVMSDIVIRQSADFEVYTFVSQESIYKASGVRSFLPFGFELV